MLGKDGAEVITQTASSTIREGQPGGMSRSVPKGLFLERKRLFYRTYP